MEIIGTLKSSPLIHRHPENPVLKPADIPYESALVFNAGVVKYQGQYVMLFRNDYGNPETQQLNGTNLGLAFSKNGIDWAVKPAPWLEIKTDEIHSINDPRLTVIDGRCFITFAVIGKYGVRGGIGVTDDFEKFEILDMSLPDNRNLVLFPEKFNQHYLRLDRPFANYLRSAKDQFDIWISDSPNLVHWGNSKILLRTTDVPFCNDKIGAGPPPIKTRAGWLVIFHAVDVDPNRGKEGWENQWNKRYTAGLMLLDLHDPGKILKIANDPFLVPEAEYEVENGFRNNVVFPCGAILEESGELKIYYGAADTVECLASADIEEILHSLGY